MPAAGSGAATPTAVADDTPVGDPGASAAIVGRPLAGWGRVTAVVNNAGFETPGIDLTGAIEPEDSAADYEQIASEDGYFVPRTLADEVRAWLGDRV